MRMTRDNTPILTDDEIKKEALRRTRLYDDVFGGTTPLTEKSKMIIVAATTILVVVLVLLGFATYGWALQGNSGKALGGLYSIFIIIGVYAIFLFVVLGDDIQYCMICGNPRTKGKDCTSCVTLVVSSLKKERAKATRLTNAKKKPLRSPAQKVVQSPVIKTLLAQFPQMVSVERVLKLERELERVNNELRKLNQQRSLGECCICLKPIDDDELARCVHCSAVGHQSHMLEWDKIRGTCPKCLKKDWLWYNRK